MNVVVGAPQRICQCPDCQQPEAHPNQRLHRQMIAFFEQLPEAHRRWYAGLEAERLGHGGARLMSQITGLEVHTISRGQRELAAGLTTQPVGRQRAPGGGRRPVEKKSAGDHGGAGSVTRPHDGRRPATGS